MINANRETFLFLTNLAYNSRLILPALVLCGFLFFNVRISMELSLDTEHINDDGHNFIQQQLLPLERDQNEANISDISMDEYSISDSESLSNVSDSDDDQVMRTLICLDVEIDHFYPEVM